MEKNPPASRRHRLLPPETGVAGETGKYVKDAIGEVILVVIGILIALSINKSSIIECI